MSTSYDEYDVQAADFLAVTQTTITRRRLGTFPYFPDDTNDRDVYEVTISNSKGTYTIDFGDSLQDTDDRAWLENPVLNHKEDYARVERLGIPTSPAGLPSKSRARELLKNWGPSDYTILATLEPYHPGAFEDFCSDYGYDTDSRKAFDTYQSVLHQHSNLSRLFTPDQLDLLAGVQ